VRPLCTLAPAKINLGLFVGPTRADGRHELVTVMQPISLADVLTLEAAPAGAAADEVVCPGVEGENLAARAIALFRGATGWDGAPVRLSIDKRIPVAAGLGGGSADAGAALRLLRAASGLGDEELLLALAAELGADVPALLAPARTLARGAGELLEPLPDPVSPVGVLVLAQAQGLSTAEVYAQADREADRSSADRGAADRLQKARDARDLRERREELQAALALGAPLPANVLLVNDLQRASQSLSPEIAPSLAQAEEAGAEHAFVSGSGPTVVGLFARANGPERARRAAAALAGRVPAPVAAETVGGGFAAMRPLGT
jgi:4-diphosphocytidyl-2-C-methyl-D-erythritol kinase